MLRRHSDTVMTGLNFPLLVEGGSIEEVIPKVRTAGL